MTRRTVLRTALLSGAFGLFSMMITGSSFARPTSNVTLTGVVTCSRCVGTQPQRKGYTQYSWALDSVDHGDDIVIVVGDKTYKLVGNKDVLLKFMAGKATVVGHFDGNLLVVATIGKPGSAPLGFGLQQA